MTAPADVTYCARHPDVETALRCGKCETLICPRCMVQTPVGARCKACANLRRPPMYEISGAVLARALAIALIAGPMFGILWGLILPVGFGFGIFGLFLGFLLGTPLGYGFADLLGRVTNHKRGPVMQSIAVGGVALAWLMHALVGGVPGELFGVILAVAASMAAVGRLR